MVDVQLDNLYPAHVTNVTTQNRILVILNNCQALKAYYCIGIRFFAALVSAFLGQIYNKTVLYT